MSRTPEQIAADRARYEEHQRKGLLFAPKALPGPSPIPAPPIAHADIIHAETVPGGWYWSTRLMRGEAIRIAQTGPSSVALVAWNAADPSERLNLPDTVKVQWSTIVSKGRVVFSDMGRVLFSVTEDSSGAHDGLLGGSTAASNLLRYGEGTRNTRDNFVIAAGKLGLDRRDIPSALTFFAPVRVEQDGKFVWRPALANAGSDYVDLRAEMDLLVALSNCPHPLDPNPTYEPAAVSVTRYHAAPPAADDLCRTATAEAIRGFENNALAEA
jgi:urea carboxylase-associated protein 2